MWRTKDKFIIECHLTKRTNTHITNYASKLYFYANYELWIKRMKGVLLYLKKIGKF